MRWLSFCAAVLIAAVSGCSSGSSVTHPGPDPESSDNGSAVIERTGTVRRYELEGGFFAIRGDDGVTYEAINLGREFERDGLRVRFRAKLRNDLGSIHMVGPIVELLHIRRAP